MNQSPAEARNAALEEAARVHEPNCSCEHPCDDYWIWPSPCHKKVAAVIRALISSAPAPIIADEELISEISPDFDKAGAVIDNLIAAIEKRFPETLDTNVLASTDMGKGLLKAYREFKAFITSAPAAPAPLKLHFDNETMKTQIEQDGDNEP